MGNTIIEATMAAMDDFHKSHCAYIQSINYILETEKASREGAEGIRRSSDKLNEYTKVFGMSPIQYLKGSLFFSQITAIEIFFQRVVKSIVREHPKKLGSIQFKLNQILDAGSIKEVVDQAIDEYLNRLMYKKPLEYLDGICDILSINKETLVPFWANFIEAKARRDVGIHNNWVCNDIYVRKVQEAAMVPAHKPGELIVPSDSEYIFASTDNLWNIVRKISEVISWKYCQLECNNVSCPRWKKECSTVTINN